LSDLILLLDIGTTTISGDIFDTRRKKPIATGLVLNAQRRFGDDIVSRIGFASQASQNARLLQVAIADSINLLLKKLLRESGRTRADIGSVLCACNSAIHHMFAGLDLSSLITPPYRPIETRAMTLQAYQLGLKLGKTTPLTLLPNIGGFVGSDALCVILSSKVLDSDKPRLVIDIGTNGEIVLGNRHNIMVASAAAGPAFEAGYIKNGMPAIKGAIDRVRIIGGKADYRVIGGGQPAGIAGSGLIDLCYAMLQTGFLKKSGLMHEKEFIVYKKRGKKISITQADIRKIQLAKAAILAGVTVLIKRSRMDISDIDKILLTGSFGSSLATRGIMGVGIIPATDAGKLRYIQDGALKGLRLYASSAATQNRLIHAKDIIKHVPLFGKVFAKEFTPSLSFP
jgi:uncharacterized 2Fe-2S/4Fe-4S cluster protein (DUF4445 family)